jgi:hypothetical protein
MEGRPESRIHGIVPEAEDGPLVEDEKPRTAEPDYAEGRATEPTEPVAAEAVNLNLQHSSEKNH